MNSLTSTRISESVQQIEGALSGVGEKIKETANLSLIKTGSLSDAITTNVQNSVQSSIQTWVDAHPIFAWILLHPLWSIGIAILVLWLTFILLSAIVDVTVEFISSLLKLPFSGFKRLFLPRQFSKPTSSQRLIEVLDRLEALRQEQDELLKQVKTMLASERDFKKISAEADRSLNNANK